MRAKALPPSLDPAVMVRGATRCLDSKSLGLAFNSAAGRQESAIPKVAEARGSIAPFDRGEGAHGRAGGSEHRHREPGKQARAPCRGERIGGPIERERNAADHLIDQHSRDGAQQASEQARRACPDHRARYRMPHPPRHR